MNCKNRVFKKIKGTRYPCRVKRYSGTIVKNCFGWYRLTTHLVNWEYKCLIAP